MPKKDGAIKAEWCEELTTGNESIDRPKKELILRINGLLDGHMYHSDGLMAKYVKHY